jgi:hypothetical protein
MPLVRWPLIAAIVDREAYAAGQVEGRRNAPCSPWHALAPAHTTI